jgi:His-Xaa-Ser system protein HxsD
VRAEPGSVDLEWAEKGDDCLSVVVSLDIYGKEAVFRACYVFTDRCYIFLAPESHSSIRVRFRKRRQSAALAQIVAEFSNELIDQRLRLSIAAETRSIRESIVNQAFAEADLNGT